MTDAEPRSTRAGSTSRHADEATVTGVAWLQRLERRTHRNVVQPWTAAVFLTLSLVLALSTLPFETGRTGRLVLAAVWLVVGLAVAHARRRDVRRRRRT